MSSAGRSEVADDAGRVQRSGFPVSGGLTAAKTRVSICFRPGGGTGSRREAAARRHCSAFSLMEEEHGPSFSGYWLIHRGFHFP
ncbi:hypothetical protein SRHO_G00110200 [Serrasalmus rhombeus]